MTNPWKITTFALAGALATSLAVSATRSARADQPHMQSAKAHLDEAIAQLQAADEDKGGHRAAALDLARRSRDQVQAGIDYARDHH